MGQTGDLGATGEPAGVLPALEIPWNLSATLVLVRHGQSTWLAEGRFQGQGDPPLSELGLRQAALAGARVAAAARPPRLPVPDGGPVAIFHSPLARTTQTAEAIARACAVDGASPALVPERGFAEIAQGEWEGLLQAEVESRYADIIDGWRREPAAVHAPGGESLVEAAARVRAGVDRVLASLAASSVRPAGPSTGRSNVPSFYDRHAGPWAVIVGHDGTFKLLVLALLGLPLERFWSFTQAPAAIAVVDLRLGRAVLRAWNRTDHLAPLEEESAEEARAEAAAAERARSGAL